ncbi:FAS1 domain-containing protein [Chlamydoabsidia padenii]|nr:FAS1 domain-containing protein [Chlamydoabsidia padenii]
MNRPFLITCLLLLTYSFIHSTIAAEERTLRQVLDTINATKLVELFDTNDLGGYLDKSSSLTLLAPPNEALDETRIPQNDIQEWLKYHIIDRRYGPDELGDGVLLKTMAGKDYLGSGNKQRIRVHVTVQDKVSRYYTEKQSIQFGRSVVVGEPVSASSSYVYPVSQALELPPDILELLPTNLDLSTLVALSYQSDTDHILQQAQGITLFAPTNEAFERLGLLTKHLLTNKDKLTKVLTFHALEGLYYNNEMELGEYTAATLNEDIHLNKTNQGLFLRGHGAADGNDRSVIGKVLADEQMLMKNGAVLKVDRVQLPLSLQVTNHDLLTSSGTTNSFLDLMEQAHLLELTDTAAYVVLAPTDRAFNRMNFTRLLQDKALVNRVARMHILTVPMPQMTLIGKQGGERTTDERHGEITSRGTEFPTLYENEKVVITLIDSAPDNMMYTVHVKNSLQEKAQVIGMGRVTNGGGVIEIDRVLLPFENDSLALSWWSFLLIVVSVLVISAIIVAGGYYVWLWWKRRQEGYSVVDDAEEEEEQQQQQSNRYT